MRRKGSNWVLDCPNPECNKDNDPNYTQDWDILNEDNDGNDETRSEVWVCRNCGTIWVETYQYVGWELMDKENPMLDYYKLFIAELVEK